MPQLENIEAIEKRLWNAADTLRSSSNYASNEYFIPVMGLIFLRHAYSRFLAAKDDISTNLPARGGKTRPLTKEDFSQKSAIFLAHKAQFDYLVSLTDRDDRARAVIEAMESIEADYETLRGVLPKSEYQEASSAASIGMSTESTPPFPRPTTFTRHREMVRKIRTASGLLSRAGSIKAPSFFEQDIL